jgi:hypothetical protein
VEEEEEEDAEEEEEIVAITIIDVELGVEEIIIERFDPQRNHPPRLKLQVNPNRRHHLPKMLDIIIIIATIITIANAHLNVIAMALLLLVPHHPVHLISK